KEINLKKSLIIQLGDTIIETDISEIISSKNSRLCIKKVKDPRAFGVADIDEKGFIISVEEKPKIPTSNMALVGFYFIKETKILFDILDKQIEKTTEEKECYLTDALQLMIESGVTFQSHIVDHWFDVGKKDVLLETNALLLRKKEGKTCENCISENTIFISPYYISKGAKIYNSIIGPNVTVGENSEIKNAIIKNSVIGSFTKLENVTLHNSLIGSDSSIMGLSQSLNIGDNTDVDLRGER
ncbi:MAG TPA: sugar phosphate nucleotidyltransferase, partial [Chitinophagales bacterium]